MNTPVGKHTKTPWSVSIHPKVIDSEWRAIISYGPNGAMYVGEALAVDAAHIVRCVNSHDALLEALKDCVTDSGATCFAHEALMIRRIKAINEIARAAIAAAEAN